MRSVERVGPALLVEDRAVEGARLVGRARHAEAHVVGAVVVGEEERAVAELRRQRRPRRFEVREAPALLFVVARRDRDLCGNQPVSWVIPTKLQNSRARSNRGRFG